MPLLVAKVNSFTENLGSIVCQFHVSQGSIFDSFGHPS